MHENHRATHLGEDIDHLLECRRVGVDHIVGECHGEGRIPASVAGHQDGVTQTTWLGLVNGRDLSPTRDGPNLLQGCGLSSLGEKRFELRARREMRACHGVARAGDEHDVSDAGRDRFLDAVLNDGSVHERQQFLGERLCRGQDSSPETGGGKDDGGDR